LEGELNIILNSCGNETAASMQTGAAIPVVARIGNHQQLEPAFRLNYPYA
jgi:hypothetical protein